MRAYSKAALLLHQDPKKSTDATRYRLLRSALCQMELKNITFTIALPALENTHDLVSYAESERGLAELLAVAPGTQVAVKFSEAEAEEGEVAAERFSRQYESIARHFAVLGKSGNPIIRIVVGSAVAASRPPHAALANLISRQRQPPRLHLAGGWCTAALAEAERFQGLAHLSLQDNTSARGWTAFSTFVTECAATLRKLELDFTLASDAAPSYVRPSQIPLPHLHTLACNFEEGAEYNVNALLVCKAPVLRCLEVALYELPGSRINVEDVLRCFPSLERIAISVMVADEQDLQALTLLLDGDPAHRHAVSVSAEDAGISLTLDGWRSSCTLASLRALHRGASQGRNPQHGRRLPPIRAVAYPPQLRTIALSQYLCVGRGRE